MHSFVPFQIFYPDLIDKTDTPEYTLVSHLSFLRTYNHCEKRLFLILNTNVHVGYKKFLDIMKKNYLLEKLINVQSLKCKLNYLKKITFICRLQLKATKILLS